MLNFEKSNGPYGETEKKKGDPKINKMSYNIR